MARYAIGDVQGHYDVLMRLLDPLDFSELWFVGDLVNRGPQSLLVLRFLMNLKPQPKIVLGNHDLYLLRLLFAPNSRRGEDTLDDVLKAHDRDEIGHWLRTKPYLIEDKTQHIVMTHAGIAPCWSMDEARSHAKELYDFSQTPAFIDWMQNFNYQLLKHWASDLKGLDRMQLISDYMTRMRFTDNQGHLDWRANESLMTTPKGSYPWYECPIRENWQETIIFGHWAALQGRTKHHQFQAIDTGVAWNGPLTALDLDSFERISTI
jgi:bis(5'-nucleosyl)-tetraphosphatase (symmetrical)